MQVVKRYSLIQEINLLIWYVTQQHKYEIVVLFMFILLHFFVVGTFISHALPKTQSAKFSLDASIKHTYSSFVECVLIHVAKAKTNLRQPHEVSQP